MSIKSIKEVTDEEMMMTVGGQDSVIGLDSKHNIPIPRVENRLEHIPNNLNNQVENTTSAESAIRDVDIASEMIRYDSNRAITDNLEYLSHN